MSRFSPRQRALLLSTARASLTNYFARHQPLREAAASAVAEALATSDDQPMDELLADGACFVTLWQEKHGQLRGCRGEFTAHQPLLSAVSHMALATALDDPRFPPVSLSELPHLRIEISVLTPLQLIRPEDVEIGRHGLLLALGSHRGLLLPEVAVEHNLDREAFLGAVCWKAGLPENAWQQPGASLWAFETEVWEEE